MMNFTNPLFYVAMIVDACGLDDTAMSLLKVDTFEEHQQYRKDCAIACGVLGIGGAFFTYGLSLLLLLVSARKMVIYRKKAKQHEHEALQATV